MVADFVKHGFADLLADCIGIVAEGCDDRAGEDTDFVRQRSRIVPRLVWGMPR